MVIQEAHRLKAVSCTTEYKCITRILIVWIFINIKKKVYLDIYIKIKNENMIIHLLHQPTHNNHGQDSNSREKNIKSNGTGQR